MSRTLFLLTHPESTHHTLSLVGGHHDSTLTTPGHNTAQSLATALRAAIPASTPSNKIKLFSSDLQRCVQTAEYISTALGGKEIVRDTRLREKSYGIAEGKPQDFLRERYVHAPQDLATSRERLEHDEGIEAETKEGWVGRLYEVMDEVVLEGWEYGSELKDGEDEYRIVVTHGGSATFLVARWIGMEAGSCGWVRFGVGSGTVTVLREDRRWRNRSVERLGVKAEELGGW